MQSVELRWNKNILEYRSLIIHEDDTYYDNEPSGSTLSLNWRQKYTDWEAVPKV